MKRTFILLVISALISVMLIGCSSPTASQKSEEELKAEIKAEMEAEAKKKADLEAEIRAEIEAEKPTDEAQQKAEPEKGNTQTQQEQETKIPEASAKEQNDILKGYTYKVDGGNLKITYTNTGESEIIIKANKIYDVIKSDSNDTSVLQRQFSVLSAEKDQNKLYFKTIDPESGWEVTYYVDVKTRKIYWVNPDQSNSGSGVSDTEESGALKLTGFKPEILHGENVDFSKYTTVIVPMYDGVNGKSLNDVRQVIGSVTQGDLSMKLNFAIFGQMKNIQLTYYAGMGAKGEWLDVGDLYNANVQIEIWLPGGDGAYVKVQGHAIAEDGEYDAAVFSLDDMRSDYEVLEYE